MNAVTDWFAGDVKPHRPGVYERLYDDNKPMYCLWTGEHWGMCHDYAEGAADLWPKSAWQGLPWRGLKRGAK